MALPKAGVRGGWGRHFVALFGLQDMGEVVGGCKKNLVERDATTNAAVQIKYCGSANCRLRLQRARANTAVAAGVLHLLCQRRELFHGIASERGMSNAIHAA